MRRKILILIELDWTTYKIWQNWPESVKFSAYFPLKRRCDLGSIHNTGDYSGAGERSTRSKNVKIPRVPPSTDLAQISLYGSRWRSRDLHESGVYVFLKYLSALFMARVKISSIWRESRGYAEQKYHKIFWIMKCIVSYRHAISFYPITRYIFKENTKNNILMIYLVNQK